MSPSELLRLQLTSADDLAGLRHVTRDAALLLGFEGAAMTRVATSASVTGSNRSPRSQRAAIWAVTSASVAPSARRPVRNRWVPRSWSPRLNQARSAS